MISVIIVVLNAAETIEHTIRSVMGQTYRDVELVIIDGGSTDGTVDVIQRYRNHIAFVLSEKDSGIYHAMTKGVAAARGEWIIFMNSGDTFAGPHVLEEVFRRGSRSEDIIYGNTIVKASQQVVRPPPIVNKRFFYFETLCHQSLFARRALFDRIGTFDLRYRIVADREWLIRAVEARSQFAHVELEVSIWDQQGFSSAHATLSRRENRQLQHEKFTWEDRALNPWLKRFHNFGRKVVRVLFPPARQTE